MFELKNNTIFLKTDINFNNVVALLFEIKKNLTNLDKITVDFKAVAYSDSSGLALMTGIIRHASSEGKTVNFTNVPARLSKAALVCGLDKVLQDIVVNA